MAQLTTIPIVAPSSQVTLNASQASTGAPIPPLRRLQIMSPEEWEEFVHEWVDSLRPTYVDVHRCGGPGDKGRDVIAFKAPIGPTAPWDNYQCKHYANPLSIPNVVAEVGKLLYFVSQGEFSIPDAYTFISPQGPSTALLNCLQKGTLKQELMARWNKECRTTITTAHPVELATVQSTIDAFDFSRVTVPSALHVIQGHQQTPYYVHRFGGGLPARTLPANKPPAAFQPNETIYVKKLLDAYGDEKSTTFATVDALEQAAPPLSEHLQRSREQFFTAESLRTFSRDTVKTGTFELLQDEILAGVQEVYEDDTHTSGYQRVRKTVQKARDIQITGNILVNVLHTDDRAGICHQLANDDKLTWIKQPTQQPEDKKP